MSDLQNYLAELDPQAAYLVLKPITTTNHQKLHVALQARQMIVLEEISFDEHGRPSQSVHTVVLKLQPTALREFIFDLAREGLEGELIGYEARPDEFTEQVRPEPARDQETGVTRLGPDLGYDPRGHKGG